MPNIDFPNSPTVNQQFTAGGKIWQWSGTTWDVVRIAVPAASLTSTDVSRLTGATSNLQTQINTLSTNLGNTLDDYVPIGDVGVADGVASLDSSGKIPIAQLGNLIDGAPTALDTLNELAAAINDDASYAAGITTALGTKISNAGGDIITSSLASTIPLRIRGAASQTANLQEWQNSAATVLARIDSTGGMRPNFLATNSIYDASDTAPYLIFGSNTLTLNTRNASYKGLVVKGTASQTANLTEWQNSAGTAVASVTSNGGIHAATFNGAVVGINYPGIVIDTSNADNTQVWLRNLSASTKSGRFVGIKARNGYANAAAGDDLVTLAGEQYVSSFNRESGKVLISNDNSTPSDTSYPSRITFHTTAINSTTLTERMRISSSGNVLVNGFTASTVGLSVKGAASQSASLQEWQNSAGTVLSNITGFGGARLYDLGIKGGPEGIAWAYFGNDNTSTKNVVVRGFASQTANLQEWQNSAGTALVKIAADGRTTFPGANADFHSGGNLTVRGSDAWSNNASTLIGTGYAGGIGLIVSAVASQTADLTQWTNSAGTVLAKITPSGALDATAITVNGAAISGGGLSPVAVSTNITMVASTRYFVDTTSTRILTLPATPALGAEIELYDASNNAFTNNVSILRNGQKINGLTDDAALDINGFAVSFIYTGSTYGWRIK